MKAEDDNKIGYVIWGTGDRSSTFSKEVTNKPLFYIDNDISKKDTCFYDRKVCHPSDITNWKDYYIVIANSFYEDIKKQLLDLGLIEESDFIYYGKVQNNKIRTSKLIEELKNSLEIFEQEYASYKYQTLIFGSMISFDKNSCENFTEAYKLVKEHTKFLMISETHAIEDRAKEGRVSFPYFCLPLMLWQNYHLKSNDFNQIEVSTEIIDYITKCEYRYEAVVDFEGKNKDIAEGYAWVFVYYADMYLRRMFEFIQPRRVCIWNQFYPFHHIIESICREKQIDLIFLEYGGLPGTYIIERNGQMGESYPAVYSEEFQKLSIDNQDLSKAREIYVFLKESGINRKLQPENQELDIAKKLVNPHQPVIVYTGQNDYESGLYPYTNRSQQYHSPIFKSSNDAAIYLSDLCKNNHWNFVYKPHPLCLEGGVGDLKRQMSDDSIIIERCNINDLLDWADLNITILSTTAYVSLIREKPVLMLGYTQLKNQGCTYEAFSENIIYEAISEALENGYTNEQRQSFINHIARLSKYYAFDDWSERPVRYGRDFKKLFSDEKILF